MKRHYPNKSDLYELARAAGRIMLRSFKKGDMSHILKNDYSPLTESDVLINNLVLNEVGRKYRHISVIGEEGSNYNPSSEFVVLVDPIDGTMPFCHGIPVSTFCISVLKNGVPVIALIYDPFCQRTWFAEKGCATTLNNKSVRATYSRQNLAHSVIAFLLSSRVPYLDKACRDLMNHHAKCINLCSVAIGGGLIASGNIAASVFAGRKAWETATMQLIVEQAGGIATDLEGNKLSYQDFETNGHIMSCSKEIHRKILEVVKSAKNSHALKEL